MPTDQDKLNNEAGGIHFCIRLSDRFDHAFAAPGGWAKIDDQDLVVSGVDDLFQLLFQPQQVDRVELAFEDGILQMVAPVSHRLEDLAEPFVVADVVRHQVDVAHDGKGLVFIFCRK